MKIDKRINLVMVCDNHLVVMLSALLKSIELHHKSGVPIDIYIVQDGISKRNMEKLASTISSENIRIIWLNIKDAIPSQFSLPSDKSTYPLCIYARLFLPYFLPDHLKKVIYLDVDMLLLEDITLLWNIDLGDNALGAVVDICDRVSIPWGGIKNFKELGIDANAKYFNSGLLVVNLERWKKLQATQSILTIVEKHKEFALYPDQYGLNVFFVNRWSELDPRWNTYSQRNTPDPFLIHFTEVKPIYKRYNLNENYRQIFYKILEQTPWNTFRPKSYFDGHMKRALSLISKGSLYTFVVKSLNVAFKTVFSYITRIAN